MICLVLTNDLSIEKSLIAGIETCGHKPIVTHSIMAATALTEELNPRVLFVDIGLAAASDLIRWVQKETGSAVIAVACSDTADTPIHDADARLCGSITVDSISRVLMEAGCVSEVSPSDPEANLERKFWDITSCIPAGLDTQNNDSELIGPPAAGRPIEKRTVSVVSQEVIAVWGAKGGEGRTTLALCLADRLHDFDVLLIDLNFTEGPGDIATILSLPALPHIGKLVDNAADRRQGFIDALIKPKRADFAVVQPPPTIEQAENISPDDIVDLIDQARRMFQIVIIDLPNDLNPLTLEALDLATAVLLVSTEDIGGLARLEARKMFIRSDTTKALIINKVRCGGRRARECAHWLEMPLAAAVAECDKGPLAGEKGDFVKYWSEMTYPAVSDILKLLFGLDMASRRRRTTFSKRIRGAISGMAG